jgi:glycosyltransferase involved in cell wall biosynthesis
MDRLEQLAKELQVSEHIHFLGIINNNELVELYHACEFFIMVSQNIEGDFEGFGISVLEAALCGKPAIVSRESGLSEAVVDQITGICVPEKDPLATAEAIIKLLHNPDELKTMAKNAELRACAGFTWNIVGKKYYEVIQKTVDYQIKQI